MILLVCALICGGPLLVVLSSVVLVITPGIVPHETSRGVLVAAFGLASVAVLGAAGASALYRWCFVRPPARGVCLLTGLVLGIFFLSHEATVAFIARAVLAPEEVVRDPHMILSLLADSGALLGVAIVCCTTVVLMVELPLRWAQGRVCIISDGTFRMLRMIGVIVILVASSSLLRDEGLRRLENTLQRAIG